MDDIDRQLINQLQYGFPISERPFAEVAIGLDISEAEVLARLNRLLEDKTLSRFGPMYQVERLGGGFSLAAMCIPADEFDAVAEQVNALPEIAHNYERDHELNMWFVIGTQNKEDIDRVVSSIEALTGYPVYNMPKLEEYYVGLYFDI